MAIEEQFPKGNIKKEIDSSELFIRAVVFEASNSLGIKIRPIKDEVDYTVNPSLRKRKISLTRPVGIKEEPDFTIPSFKRRKISSTTPVVYGNSLCPKHKKNAKPEEIKIEDENEKSFKNFKRNISFDVHFDRKTVSTEVDLKVRYKSRPNKKNLPFRKYDNNYQKRLRFVPVPARLAHRVKFVHKRNFSRFSNKRRNTNEEETKFEEESRCGSSLSSRMDEAKKSEEESRCGSSLSSTSENARFFCSAESVQATTSKQTVTSNSSALNSNENPMEVKVVGFCCMICEKQKNIEIIDVEKQLNSKVNPLPNNTEENDINVEPVIEKLIFENDPLKKEEKPECPMLDDGNEIQLISTKNSTQCKTTEKEVTSEIEKFQDDDCLLIDYNNSIESSDDECEIVSCDATVQI